MSLMGWSSANMAARYQHVTDPIRREVARQVDDLIWQARGRGASSAAGNEDAVPVDRGVLAAILRLAEVGLAHCEPAEMAAAGEAVEFLRAALTDN